MIINIINFFVECRKENVCFLNHIHQYMESSYCQQMLKLIHVQTCHLPLLTFWILKTLLQQSFLDELGFDFLP